MSDEPTNPRGSAPASTRNRSDLVFAAIVAEEIDKGWERNATPIVGALNTIQDTQLEQGQAIKAQGEELKNLAGRVSALETTESRRSYVPLIIASTALAVSVAVMVALLLLLALRQSPAVREHAREAAAQVIP